MGPSSVACFNRYVSIYIYGYDPEFILSSQQRRQIRVCSLAETLAFLSGDRVSEDPKQPVTSRTDRDDFLICF